jgi:bifunctional non-homologous end joining protein LigD
MSLLRYRQKRRFEETPEPRGNKTETRGDLRFVVQMHQASRLHFDFRLEHDGALKSWAVPKGPSLNPADKRLAVMVEDHPLDYRSFEGNIPAGNYGAGTVIVWDEGTYRAAEPASGKDSERALQEGLRRGHLSVELDGHKLKGGFSLIKLNKGKKNEWLLVKKDDEWARVDEARDDRSVQSGRRLDEVAANGAPGPRKLSPKTKGRVEPIRSAIRSKPPKPVEPMLATAVEEAFDRDGWIFEIKWDGYRAIGETGKDGRARLYSRRQQPFEKKFAPIVESLRNLHRDAILDGEVVVLDDKGKSQFQLLQNYQKYGQGPLLYYAFDLLALDGKDLRQQPLRRRRQLLKKLLDENELAAVRFSDHVETDGRAFFAVAAKQGLEGIIAKNSVSRYVEGKRSLEWLKIKTHLRQEAVIGGFTRPKGSRQQFGALVLGVFDVDELIYIGHTGGGFNDASLTDLRSRLERLRQPTCPFRQRPHTNTPAQWVKPELVCEVQFQGWSRDGHMRQPIFVGLREDKMADAVHRETKLAVAAAVDEKASKAREAKRKKPAPTQPDDGVALTHLEKLYWPDQGLTKGDLINYYREMADIILPYLQDRPQSLHRHPNGILGQSFFQKDVARQPPPPFVETTRIRLEHEKRDILVPLCQDKPSLLYLANLGCIELNPWNSRIGQLDRPDYLIIDLDPEDIPFVRVVEAAIEVHKLLDRANAPNYCKTSGKRGLHIYVPLAAQFDYDLARQFAEVVANLVCARLPESTSVVRSPAKRQKKVYLDYLQNRRGQTLAAAYSVRPYPAATVSTPLKWSEVTRRLDPARFTIHSVPKRLDKVGDLWQPVLGAGAQLRDCLDRLGP